MKTNLESRISALPLESQQALIEHPAFFALIKELIEIIEKQQQEIAELQQEVKHLRDQLHLDSHNSSYPPYPDKSRTKSGKKVNSLRKTTDKKPGGQEGHTGSTLRMVPHPHNTISHEVKACYHWRYDLSSTPVAGIERRQVFDLPPLNFAVTEHQVEVKTCPVCHNLNQGSFLEGEKQVVQYGETQTEKGLRMVKVKQKYQVVSVLRREPITFVVSLLSLQ